MSIRDVILNYTEKKLYLYMFIHFYANLFLYFSILLLTTLLLFYENIILVNFNFS